MTAKDLLNKILDYQYIWVLPQNIDSRSAKLRLEQIEILLDAFGLTKNHVNPLVQIKYFILGEKDSLNRSKHLNKLSNIQYFLQGEFLHDREIDANKDLCKKIVSTICSIDPHLINHVTRKPIDLSWLFNNLLYFRQNLHQLIFSNSEMIEGFSPGLYYSHYLQQKLNTLIIDNLSEIDETLCEIIDPLKREINMSNLQNKYNYIDHNFDSIDLDWRVENY